MEEWCKFDARKFDRKNHEATDKKHHGIDESEEATLEEISEKKQSVKENNRNQKVN